MNGKQIKNLVVVGYNSHFWGKHLQIILLTNPRMGA
jgi:hypothetical protein